MASRHPSPETSDDEAPESFSFGTSKAAAKGEQGALHQFQAAEKQKNKRKNQERDRVLKERAAQAKANAVRKGKGKAAPAKKAAVEKKEESHERHNAHGEDDLETRMKRAMKEAEEESDIEDDAEGRNGSKDGLEESDAESAEDEANSSSDRGVEEEEGEEEEEEEEEEKEGGRDESEDEEYRKPLPTSPSKKNYLPDHLFQSALSKVPSTSSSKRKLDVSGGESKPPAKKRKRAKRTGKGKDILVGSKMIRTLPQPSTTPVPRAMIPPGNTKKFLKRTLQLKSSASNSKVKGWERRAANVGIMRRNGPAASFVRS
ncbi:hypothetical protein WOLCODRAFT_167324 [Wolfiporia cocos MD-104 SS10]|uniref:Uncharacterized protein n=1 Tax=Wolfiporia cocos (strain MD-104) TaxID=742152 RepID=A0A2H3J4K5_WOLCO|nr:hypothetical protein WOLCODRAFT_167324 [Wolfiporia cocos MD-104 SS10]